MNPDGVQMVKNLKYIERKNKNNDIFFVKDSEPIKTKYLNNSK
jgi:hypothetical protein